MFPGQKLMFSGEKHMFPDVKLMFPGEKYKITRNKNR